MRALAPADFTICACKKAIIFPLRDFIQGMYNVSQLCVHSQIQFGEKGRLSGEFEHDRTHVNRTLAKFSCENHVLRNVVNSILLGKKVKRASYVALAAPGH